MYGTHMGKGIFFGNMKGGVGKSTLCSYTCAMLKEQQPRLNLMLIDTDPQGSTAHMMEKVLPTEKLRHMPIGDRYDTAMLSMVDGVARSHFTDKKGLLIVDSASGMIGNLWQIVMLCNAIIIPTSLSWLDIEPTVDYVKEIDARKTDFASKTPHIIVVPNRNSPNQKDYGKLNDIARELDVVLAPPVCDYSYVRKSVSDFNGVGPIKGTRFEKEVKRLADFITTHIHGGELDRIYSDK